jgi:predicted metal-dependent phosphoesterase TrpH
MLFFFSSMIDLHTHSSASDGNLAPSELVDYAVQKGISVLALTDHDTTDGLEEAAAEAKLKGITFVPGIELNIEWPTGEFHLLGLGLQTVSPALFSIISYLQRERNTRNEKMAAKLKEGGIPISLEEVEERFHTNALGRPHFAQLMVEKGIVKYRQQAFDKYLAKGRPYYVDRAGADLAMAVDAIKSSGGVPVQAHPLSLYVSWGKMDDTMAGIRAKGVEGLEAFHPGVRVAEAERLEKLARKLGMFVTAGSDFHGEKVRADRHIGFTAGGKKIEDRFWKEELQPHLQKV